MVAEARNGVPRDRPIPRLWCWERLPRLGFVLRGPVLELHYRPGAHTWRELQALVDEEQAASPFVTWNLTARSGRLIVEVHAPADRLDYVHGLAAFIQAVDRATTVDRQPQGRT